MNPRAAGLVWSAGQRSFVQDVNFSAGLRASFRLAPKYPQRDPGARRSNTRESQNPSLWVREGGGGIFRDVWTADTTAVVGLRVQDTQTASTAYQISCEHHLHHEVQFSHASEERRVGKECRSRGSPY